MLLKGSMKRSEEKKNRTKGDGREWKIEDLVFATAVILS